jgi:hypothetical protein
MKREPDLYCNLYYIDTPAGRVRQYAGQMVYTREQCETMVVGSASFKRFAVLKIYIKDKTK